MHEACIRGLRKKLKLQIVLAETIVDKLNNPSTFLGFRFPCRGESSPYVRRRRPNDLAECAGEYSATCPEIIQVLSNEDRFICLSFSTTLP